ncbi:MAG: AraC family transcriptional regulator [Eubacteriales bacterium]|nr:AraC family transcriptional regulator [Eubacteriales bacterium]
MSEYDEMKREIAHLKFQMQENTVVHNSYMREKRELECIRQGNVEGLKQCIREPMHGPVGTLSKDALRSRKYVAVCAMAIYARAAIDGGILSDDAFAAGDSWAIKIDEAKSIEEVGRIAGEMAVFFAQMVREHLEETKNQEQQNKRIEECKKYIFQHLHEKLTVKEIARNLLVNPDYLSHLFVECEGITISNYIQGRRVDQAKNLLMYSPYDGKSIASYLGFSSQSHFGHVFKEHTGMTPKEYREKYGK